MAPTIASFPEGEAGLRGRVHANPSIGGGLSGERWARSVRSARQQLTNPRSNTMKRFIAIAAAMFAMTAFAEDVKTVETKKTTTASPTKKTTATTTTTTTDPAGMNNGTTDTTAKKTEQKVTETGGKETNVETTKTHDAPGMKNDKKTSVKTKVVRDANGKVVESAAEVK
jgi:hypothetical protein